MTDGFGIPLADQRVREGLRVEVRQLDELEIDDLIRWRALSEPALESDPFQQPEFVLPVTANRPPRQPVRLVLVLDWRMLVTGATLTIAVTMLFGLAPALRASSTPLVDALKETRGQRSHRRLTDALTRLGAEAPPRR